MELEPALAPALVRVAADEAARRGRSDTSSVACCCARTSAARAFSALLEQRAHVVDGQRQFSVPAVPAPSSFGIVAEELETVEVVVRAAQDVDRSPPSLVDVLEELVVAGRGTPPARTRRCSSGAEDRREVDRGRRRRRGDAGRSRS